MLRRYSPVLSLLLAGGLLSSVPLAAQDKQEKKSEATFKMTESLRKEFLTQSEGTSTTSQSAWKGHFKIELTMPISAVTGNALNPDAEFGLHFGTLKVSARLRDDINWKPGMKSVTLKFKSILEKDKVQTVLGTAKLKWTADKLSVDFEGDTPSLASPAAQKYADADPGKFEAEGTASVLFGDGREFQEYIVTLNGVVKRKNVNSAFLSGGVTTVDVKGRGLPSNTNPSLQTAPKQPSP